MKAEEIVVCNQCSVGQDENKMALQSHNPRWGHSFEAALTRSFNKINTLQMLGRNEKLTSAHRQTGTCLKCEIYGCQKEGKKPWFL